MAIDDGVRPARPGSSRVEHIAATMSDQWSHSRLAPVAVPRHVLDRDVRKAWAGASPLPVFQAIPPR